MALSQASNSSGSGRPPHSHPKIGRPSSVYVSEAPAPTRISAPFAVLPHFAQTYRASQARSSCFEMRSAHSCGDSTSTSLAKGFTCLKH